MATTTKTSLILKTIGLLLFIGGFALYNSSIFLSTYMVDEKALAEVVPDKEHLKVLRPELKGLLGKEYSGKHALLTDFNDVLEKVNKKYRDAQQWDQVIYKDYNLPLVRKAMQGPVKDGKLLFFLLTFGACILGGLLFIFPKLEKEQGIKNDHIWHRSMTSVGWLGIVTGTWLILFYVALYWFPAYMSEMIVIADPFSQVLNGGAASQWFMYGFIYTLAIVVMGIRMLIKYRHSTYHQVRTLSLMFFQSAFAFLIPEILVRLNKPYYDFKNIWPLDYDFFYPWHLSNLTSGSNLGLFMLAWGITLAVLAVPILSYFYGKRWYCSWVCGCGGLAETLGDPYRQLSDKSLKAWEIERWIVHGVLVFSIITTGMVGITAITGAPSLLGIPTETIKTVYGFAIGSMFAGVIGVGFYPLMGNRVWCRFGCPLAAYLGLVQRFKSRFRITTNGGQCISCGNCSTYCEMGIDVRWYAQRGQNIVRSSCVGCGICSSVCPRGVLKLENGPEEGRFGKPFTIGHDGIKVNN